MATSTLLQTGEQQPARKGQGTAALGPSDTSDSGSDLRGGPGLYDDPGIGLDRGTHEDIERDSHRSAGQDVGTGDAQHSPPSATVRSTSVPPPSWARAIWSSEGTR